jgi:hypothetical protein
MLYKAEMYGRVTIQKDSEGDGLILFENTISTLIWWTEESQEMHNMYYQRVSGIIKTVDLNYTSKILLLCLPARGPN